MENVKIAVDGKKLVITIDMAYRGVTTDKGNTRVASTLGNKEVPGSGGVMLGLNAYIGNKK